MKVQTKVKVKVSHIESFKLNYQVDQDNFTPAAWNIVAGVQRRRVKSNKRTLKLSLQYIHCIQSKTDGR